MRYTPWQKAARAAGDGGAGKVGGGEAKGGEGTEEGGGGVGEGEVGVSQRAAAGMDRNMVMGGSYIVVFGMSIQVLVGMCLGY